MWPQNFSGSLGDNPANPRNWTQGDWNYDGSVDGSDVALWAQNFTGALGGGALSPTTITQTGTLLATDLTPQAVPEPGRLVFLIAGAMGMRRRRMWW